MIKNSTEMIALAKECIRRMLERCIEREKQPSMMELFYEAYMRGVNDAVGQVAPKPEEWHYIELEGKPSEDFRYWCLVKYEENWYDTTIGWYEEEKDLWHLDYHANAPYKVVAWHILPERPE